jgi:hypothetical protein
MTMGRKKSERQGPLFVPAGEIDAAPGHAFYDQLSALLTKHGFDAFVEELCRPFYAERMGRPSLPPGIYFRMLMVGLWVSSDGVSFCDTSLMGLCAFNPQIQLVPLPDWDCNENGLDDQLDLATGLSQDLNSNGVLDECEPSAWSDEGCALAGVNGDPLFVGSGTLAAGSINAIDLSNAAPSAFSALFLAASSTPTAFYGGTLKAAPWLTIFYRFTDPTGEISSPFTMPAGLPAGTELWLQWAISDAAAIEGVSLSNAIKGVTP